MTDSQKKSPSLLSVSVSVLYRDLHLHSKTLGCLQTDKDYKSLLYPTATSLKRMLLAFSSERILRTWQTKVREKVIPTHH